jgi:hypothetical protein
MQPCGIVYGVGTIREYNGLGQVKAEADRVGRQAKDANNTHGYRYYAFEGGPINATLPPDYT